MTEVSRTGYRDEPGRPVGHEPRRRLTGVLFGGVALGSTAHIAAVTVSTLAVEEITGSATLAGVPSAMAVVGTAIGTSLLTGGVAKRGRRPGLLAGYALAVVGAVTSVIGLANLSFSVLLAGMVLLGVGNASSHLARYTAADMYPAQRRGAALGLVVWGGTVGSVLGPVLLQPSGEAAAGMGRSELAGGYMVAAAFMALSLLLYLFFLRPDPASLAVDRGAPTSSARGGLLSALRLAQVKMALTAMVTGQVVMVMIMTATPLHIHHHGSGLGIVGLVMSAHTLGMFALSPLTGRLVDRWTGTTVALGGIGLLALSAVFAALGPNESTVLLVFSLFVLGVGWNMTFVAGSSLLTVGLGSESRTRLQGRVDSVTWASGAVASIASGIVYQLTDFQMTSLIGLFLLLPPALVILRGRQAPVEAAA